MKKALVIVDMQDDFYTAHHEGTIRNVIKSIKFAKTNGMPIVVLEYEYMGRTLKRIRKHLDDYKNTIYKIKEYDDGGREVILALRKNGFDDVKMLAVCGININACVSSTISTLVRRYKVIIKVIKQACWGHTSNRKRGFKNSDIYKDKNVELLDVAHLCQI